MADDDEGEAEPDGDVPDVNDLERCLAGRGSSKKHDNAGSSASA